MPSATIDPCLRGCPQRLEGKRPSYRMNDLSAWTFLRDPVTHCPIHQMKKQVTAILPLAVESAASFWTSWAA